MASAAACSLLQRQPTVATGQRGDRGAEELSRLTARAVDRACVLCIDRANAAQFATDLPEFEELMLKRRHLLLQRGMHALAMQQAIEKHQDDAKHPSEELQEALRLARKSQSQETTSSRRRSLPSPHPHVPSRQRPSWVAEEARRAMLEGIEVHHVATKMGLTKSTDAPGQISSRPSLVCSGSKGGNQKSAAESGPTAQSRFLEAVADLQTARKVLALAS